jgi:hypothetical protein
VCTSTVVESTFININAVKSIIGKHVSGSAGAEVFSIHNVGADLGACIAPVATVGHACESVASHYHSFWARADERSIGISASVGASTVVDSAFVDVFAVGIIDDVVSWEAFAEESAHGVGAHLLAVVGIRAQAFVDISFHFADLVKDGADFTVKLEEVIKEKDIISSGGNALKFNNIGIWTNTDSNNSCCLGVDVSCVHKNGSGILGDAVSEDNDCSWDWVVSSPSIVWLEVMAVGNFQSSSSHGTTTVVWGVIDGLHDLKLIIESVEEESGIAPTGVSDERNS